MHRLLPLVALILSACPMGAPVDGAGGLVFPCAQDGDCATGFSCDDVYATCTSPPSDSPFDPGDLLPLPSPTPGDVDVDADTQDPGTQPAHVFDTEWTRGTGGGWSVSLFELEQSGAQALAVFGNDGCASARVLINEVPVLNPSDLNPNVTQVERSVLLQQSNVVRARLTSQPGCSITLDVIALVGP